MQNIIHLSFDIRGKTQQVFDMLVNPKKLTKWLCRKAEVKPKIGGKYVLSGLHPTDGTVYESEIVQINDGKILLMDWNFPGQSPTMLQFVLHSKGAYTELTLIHLGWGSFEKENQIIKETEHHWQVALNKLKKYIELDTISAKVGVTGLGGVFFKAKDPEKLKKWYDKHLDFGTDQYGKTFRWVQRNHPQDSGSTQWSIMPQDTQYYEPSQKPFMLNYRVGHLAKLLDQLKNDGVEIVGEIESYDYGKFGWIMDPEGNKIELWEPIDEVFDNL